MYICINLSGYYWDYLKDWEKYYFLFLCQCIPLSFGENTHRYTFTLSIVYGIVANTTVSCGPLLNCPSGGKWLLNIFLVPQPGWGGITIARCEGCIGAIQVLSPH